jgi:hemerythrin-like domain-containing protein
MKRHPSLHALSEHHHHALVEALLIRRACQRPAADRSTAVRRVAKDFVRFWHKTGRTHFREEEEIVLLAYARHGALHRDQDVIEMLSQHASIRAGVGDLEARLKQEQDVEAEVTELGHLLSRHVRLEEYRVFPRIESTLEPGELKVLGKRLTRLHRSKKRA